MIHWIWISLGIIAALGACAIFFFVMDDEEEKKKRDDFDSWNDKS